MAKDDDLEKDARDEDDESDRDGSAEGSDEASSRDQGDEASAKDESDESGEEDQKEEAAEEEETNEAANEEREELVEEESLLVETPAQLGHRRFVYAAYLAAAILLAFLGAKLVDFSWLKLGQWKPELGEPKEELVAAVSAVLAALVALRYWRDQKTRQLAEEVAEELTKVTWPSRREVVSSTSVVIFATAFATIYFALMDRFWSFVTNLIYGS